MTLSLAMIHAALGDTDQAVMYVEELIARNPHQSGPITALSHFYYSELMNQITTLVFYILLAQKHIIPNYVSPVVS